MGNFAHARNLVQPVQLVAPGSPLAPAQMFRNLLRENRSRTSMGFMARASRQKCVAQMRCLGPVPVAGVPISTGAADSRRSCRLRPARPVVRRRGQRRPAAKAADCAPLGAMEAAREGASDPDFRSHAALLADPGGGGFRRWKAGSPDWPTRLGSSRRRTEWSTGGGGVVRPDSDGAAPALQPLQQDFVGVERCRCKIPSVSLPSLPAAGGRRVGDDAL